MTRSAASCFPSSGGSLNPSPPFTALHCNAIQCARTAIRGILLVCLDCCVPRVCSCTLVSHTRVWCPWWPRRDPGGSPAFAVWRWFLLVALCVLCHDVHLFVCRGRMVIFWGLSSTRGVCRGTLELLLSPLFLGLTFTVCKVPNLLVSLVHCLISFL